MPAQWTAEIVGKMHANRIQQSQLAKHMGVTPEYVSMILNGHREPQHAQERFRAALDELIASKA
jgi:transcriptional regulator with XRE-family HTH domain